MAWAAFGGTSAVAESAASERSTTVPDGRLMTRAGATASNRIVSAGTPMVRMPDDELAAWTQELLDGITG